MDKISTKTIKLALSEDIGTGDITTKYLVPSSIEGKAVIVAKSPGVLSGSEAFGCVFKLISPRVKVKFYLKDGERFKIGAEILSISGPARVLLTGERVALNLLSHLSGVASLTAAFVEQVKGTKAAILDTRKTTPGLRYLEKRAVRHGGGKNHRLGLFDMILIKDNHIDAAGGVARALSKVKKVKFKVEIEVADFRQIEEALDFNPDIIMLDNFKIKDLQKAVKIIRRHKPGIKIEASGGVSIRVVSKIARTGVDYISVGALTHSAPAIDFSMRYQK
jgi:nicotinate-nucleotide pyrophosphorylase (carboxylating)